MDSFTVALTNVLITLFYLVPGFVLRKIKKAEPAHLPTLSGVLVYIGAPFLLVSAFMNLEYSDAIVWDMVYCFIVTIVLQFAFMLILSRVLGKKTKETRYRIINASSVLGNVGFFGIPVLKALFPQNPELICFSAVNMLSMNLIAFTVGSYFITGEKRFISFKAALFNPTTAGFVVALPFFIFGLADKLPDLLVNAINAVANISTPLCMIILGIRLASAPLKSIFSQPTVYINAALKLIIFPLFCYVCMYFLPLNAMLKSAVVILAGMPCAAVVLNLAEMYRSDSATTANCLIVSTLLSFITIPLLTLLIQ